MKPIKQYLKFDEAYNFYNSSLFNKLLPGIFITLQSKGGGFGYFASGRFKSIENSEKLDEIALNPDYFFYGETEIMQTLVHEMCHQWQNHFGKKSRSGYHNKQWGDMMESIGLMPSSTGEPGGKKTGQKVADYIIKDGLFAMHTKRLLKKDKVIDWQYFSWESHQLQTIKSLNDNVMQFETTENIKENALITVGHNTAQVDSVDHDTNSVSFHYVSGPGNIKPNTEAFIKIQAPKPKNKIKYSCPDCGLNMWGKPNVSVLCVKCNKMLLS